MKNVVSVAILLTTFCFSSGCKKKKSSSDLTAILSVDGKSTLNLLPAQDQNNFKYPVSYYVVHCKSGTDGEAIAAAEALEHATTIEYNALGVDRTKLVFNDKSSPSKKEEIVIKDFNISKICSASSEPINAYIFLGTLAIRPTSLEEFRIRQVLWLAARGKYLDQSSSMKAFSNSFYHFLRESLRATIDQDYPDEQRIVNLQSLDARYNPCNKQKSDWEFSAQRDEIFGCKDGHYQIKTKAGKSFQDLNQISKAIKDVRITLDVLQLVVEQFGLIISADVASTAGQSSSLALDGGISGSAGVYQGSASDLLKDKTINPLKFENIETYGEMGVAVPSVTGAAITSGQSTLFAKKSSTPDVYHDLTYKNPPPTKSGQSKNWWQNKAENNPLADAEKWKGGGFADQARSPTKTPEASNSLASECQRTGGTLESSGDVCTCSTGYKQIRYNRNFTNCTQVRSFASKCEAKGGWVVSGDICRCLDMQNGGESVGGYYQRTIDNSPHCSDIVKSKVAARALEKESAKQKSDKDAMKTAEALRKHSEKLKASPNAKNSEEAQYVKDAAEMLENKVKRPEEFGYEPQIKDDLLVPPLGGVITKKDAKGNELISDGPQPKTDVEPAVPSTEETSECASKGGAVHLAIKQKSGDKWSFSDCSCNVEGKEFTIPRRGRSSCSDVFAAVYKKKSSSTPDATKSETPAGPHEGEKTCKSKGGTFNGGNCACGPDKFGMPQYVPIDSNETCKSFTAQVNSEIKDCADRGGSWKMNDRETKKVANRSHHCACEGVGKSWAADNHCRYFGGTFSPSTASGNSKDPAEDEFSPPPSVDPNRYRKEVKKKDGSAYGFLGELFTSKPSGRSEGERNKRYEDVKKERGFVSAWISDKADENTTFGHGMYDLEQAQKSALDALKFHAPD